ncbi:hypothetical protein [Rhizobium leguminosarum]
MFEAIRKFLGFGTKRPAVIYPFRPLINALKEKDAELYDKLKDHIPSQFRKEWQKVYPEDFPLDGDSPPDARSIKPKGR